MEGMNESRRALLANMAKAVPVTALAAAAMAGSSKPVFAAKTSGQSTTALLNNFVPGTGGFVGTLTVNSFQVVNGALNAVAQLTGNVLGPTGSVLGTVNQSITMPLQVAGSCTILTLTLGPLDLNLLGLMIHLDQVVLNITAVPGAGNLLGNLLCAVANLLNGGGALGTLLNNLANLLNQILGAL
jgi:hypothetical protein